jgi:hypothetical protein
LFRNVRKIGDNDIKVDVVDNLSFQRC